MWYHRYADSPAGQTIECFFQDTGYPRRLVSYICSCCEGAVNLVSLSTAKLQRIGFNLEFETLFECQNKVNFERMDYIKALHSDFLYIF